ncbi:glycosyl hydrolase [uncultured Bacteroides sp.]|uniref:glycosyl hydrolase n=1 Tax=uncultured Bacteroides sp. TaxID=162156 RepID=UPI00262EDCFB|nr:glycosyl hydrolase [uncultured Bacteroides sp.]
MKLNSLKWMFALAVPFMFTACDDDVEHDIPAVDAPVVVSVTPTDNAVVKAGDITVEVTYDKNVFFASQDIDKISITNGTVVSGDVFGSSSTLTLVVNIPQRGTEATLTIPAGVVTGPNRMPAPEVVLNLQTLNIKSSLVAANNNANAMKLYSFLANNYGTNVISAMMANVAWDTTPAEQVNTWTGKYPAINCFDYIHLQSSVAGVNWINYGDITPVKNWVDNGGIVACMWHWNVPKSADTPNDYTATLSETAFDATKVLEAGTWENGIYTKDMESIIDYLKLIKEYNNTPVLWRPLHEAAGGWFWWGKDAESFKAIWIDMFNKFKAAGLDNMIWIWTSEGNDDDWYPGDAYVDIIGRDLYGKSAEECASEFKNLANKYGDKLVALTECGYSEYTDTDNGKMSEQWTAGANWSWFMPWYDGKKSDGVTPIHHATEEWWKDAMSMPNIIDRTAAAEALK